MGTSILVVVEDVATAERLAKELTARGFCVAVACNADDAQHTADIACFALAIIDLRRPGFGGLAIASALRGRSHHRGLQVIALIDDALDVDAVHTKVPFLCGGIGSMADAAERTTAAAHA